MIMRKIVLVLASLIVMPSIIASESRLVTVGVPTGGIVPKSPKAADEVRLVTVYLPPGYDDTNECFPVIYYIPGFSGTNTTFNVSNKRLLDALIAQKRIVPLIVVYNDPGVGESAPESKCLRRYTSSWYTNSALNGQFEDFITQNTVAFIDANFRTNPDKAFRAIMGQSMGGYGSLLLGMRHPDVFSGFGSASGTSFYTIATTDLASPGNPLFTLNSYMLPNIPTDGPNAGKILPENDQLTFQVFSYSGALSPNPDAVNGISVNPFIDQFCVDMPILVNGDGTPVLGPGPAFGADPVNGDPIEFENTLVLDQDVIDRWKENDPFFVMDDFIDTLREQCIYLDGGDAEFILAVGGRLLSEKLATNQIDHEYILFKGGHTTCLTSIFCARHSAMFEYFSAKFAEAGICANKVRTKLIGTGTVILEDDVRMIIDKGSWLGIETSPELNVTETDIAIELNDRAQLLIGTEDTLGGALQIGNQFSKARIFGDPGLNDHVIRCAITLCGPKALFNIGQQGFFGIGAGAGGKSPNLANRWSMSSLTNLKDVKLTIKKGIFQHNQITSGQEPTASLLGIGPSESYTIIIHPPHGIVRGGGNLVCLPDGWRRHPIVLDKPGQIQPQSQPQDVSQCVQFTCDVRTNLNKSTNTDDYFYKQEMASTGFYTLPGTANILSSSEQLDDRESSNNPFELIDATDIDTVCEFLNANPYKGEASKEGAIACNDGTLRIAYLDEVKNDETTTFVRTEDIPIGCCQDIDFDKVLKTGTIGIWVEEVDGERKLIRVYDLKP